MGGRTRESIGCETATIDPVTGGFPLEYVMPIVPASDSKAKEMGLLASMFGSGRIAFGHSTSLWNGGEFRLHR